MLKTHRGGNLFFRRDGRCFVLEDTASVFADVPLPSRWEGDRCFLVEPRVALWPLTHHLGRRCWCQFQGETKPHALAPTPLGDRLQAEGSPAWVQ